MLLARAKQDYSRRTYPACLSITRMFSLNDSPKIRDMLLRKKLSDVSAVSNVTSLKKTVTNCP
jgi:hypothetical protein